jgi:acyl-CoA dehydrogenase
MAAFRAPRLPSRSVSAHHWATKATTGSAVSESGSIVAETAARIFADLADPQTVNSAKDGAWKQPLWRALSESGLTLAWVPEAQGGAGAELADGFAILDVAGRYAAAVPLAETLLAGWLLMCAGLKAPQGAMTVAPARPGDKITLNADGTLSGQARGVPFAKEAQHIAVFAGGSAALVERSACGVSDGVNLAGEPSGTVVFDRVKPLAVAPCDVDQTVLMMMGCVMRAVQTAGALQAILDFTVRYANERVAFEKPIGKFQAVQHNLARLAGEVSAAMTAAHSAADAIANGSVTDDTSFLLEVAAAKIRSAEAAQEGAAIAHQVHGAIGFTKEHILHRYTLRMLAWRDDFGNESYWAVELGNAIAKRGADEFWPLVAAC